jgi:hypothetical protein
VICNLFNGVICYKNKLCFLLFELIHLFVQLIQNLIAMKTIRSCVFLFLALAIFSCKKEEEEKETCTNSTVSYPDSVVTARVVFRNTNTPVSNAIVTLFNIDINQGLAMPVDQIGKVANAEGYFTLDSALVRSYIYGRRSDGEFCGDMMTCAVEYSPTVGELLKLELTPFSWIKVKAIDSGTANPEVTHVSLYVSPHSVDHGGGTIIPLNPGEPFVFRTQGSEYKEMNYRVNAGGVAGPLLGTSNFWTGSLDTTEVVIFY